MEDAKRELEAKQAKLAKKQKEDEGGSASQAAAAAAAYRLPPAFVKIVSIKSARPAAAAQ